MQICEYYREENLSGFNCFEGRWRWEIKNENATGITYWITFLWTDLFGKEENATFTSNQPHLYVQELFPLRKNFGLVNVLDRGSDTRSLCVIEFDWKRNEFYIGENFNESQGQIFWSVLLDPSPLASGDFNVLIFVPLTNVFQHCRVDVKNRQIIQNGSNFELPSKNFICLNLNGDTITGFYVSMKTVNRFDVRRRIMLDQTKIYGIPPATRFIWINAMDKRNDGCWTSQNEFFTGSIETETVNYQKRDYFKICCINLETGKVAALSYKFPHRISQFFRSSEDGNLYVKCTEDVVHNHANSFTLTYKYYFYRIPVETPESMFFTAFKNVPKPLPDFVRKLALMRKDLPLNIYKCE